MGCRNIESIVIPTSHYSGNYEILSEEWDVVIMGCRNNDTKFVGTMRYRSNGVSE